MLRKRALSCQPSWVWTVSAWTNVRQLAALGKVRTMCAPLYLFLDPLQQVGRAHVLVVLLGQLVKAPRLINVLQSSSVELTAPCRQVRLSGCGGQELHLAGESMLA